MEERKLSEKESLELISRMISETREQFGRSNGRIFLLWGYLTITISILVYLLLYTTGSPWVQLLWWLIPLAGYPSMLFIIRKEEKRVTTFIDRMISNIWIVIGLCACITPILCIFVRDVPILFIEALLINAGVAMSGLTLRFRPVTLLGFLGIALSFGLWFIRGIDQALVFGIYVGLLMVIPGHCMNIQSKKTEENAYV